MNNSSVKSKGTIITLIGIVVMTTLIIMKLFQPESLYSGYAMLFGIACFFIVEAVDKTPDEQSGVRFKSIISDLKKPQVLLWVLLPIGLTIAEIVGGKLFFETAYRKYIDHVIGRTSLEMDFSNALNWALVSAVTVVGEEIAFRGFLFGKSSKVLPRWVCFLLSATLFALGHMASGNSVIVFYDLALIFIDAIMYALAYQHSGNAIISFIPHCTNNLLGLVLLKWLFM